MKVEGETAKRFTAVRLDTYASVEGAGELLLADDQSGEVKWTDRTGTVISKTLGAHAIHIIRRIR